MALTADGAGRLWVAWQAANRLRVRRTAPDATLEPPTYLPALPPGRAPEDTDWEIQARDGQLDLLAGGTARRGETTTNWHGAIRP